MTSITEKMVAGGSCITRVDGKAVFVPFALPGETVEIEITENRKDYAFARLVSVLEPSTHRVTPPCPLFGLCGGCSLQMAANEYQRELRLSILRDTLSRAHVSIPGEISVVFDEPFGYRSRFQFHRTNDGRIGLKEGEGSTIIPVNDCPVAVASIREALGDGTLAREVRKRNTGDRFHVFAYESKLWSEDKDSLCTVPVAGESLSFDVRGFFQSNIAMLEKMVAAVCSGIPQGTRLLDFYSGVGTFSLFAGTSFAETVLVEHNREALVMAEKNLSGKKTSPSYCAVSDEHWPRHPLARLPYDAAIVDPPRQGLSKAALDWFATSKIPEVRYVSCDPVTFARDAAKLCTAGYTLHAVSLFDFYPQTHHIETLGLFRR